MNNYQNFSIMNAEQLMEVNGGGFAYDVGRILRLIARGGPNSMTAIADWIANDVVNEVVNG